MPLTEITTHFVDLERMNPQGIVIDAGASLGRFVDGLQSRPGFENTYILAVEASPELAAGLEKKYANWTVIHAALVGDDAPEMVTFLAGDNADSGNVILPGMPPSSHACGSESTVPTVVLRSLLREYDLQDITLLKMDIEGSELSVLRSLDYRTAERISQIALEWHPWVKAALDIPRLLHGFGYTVSRQGGASITAIRE